MEKKINDGLVEHKIKDIGNAENPYITRYMLDLEVKTAATEIRIHADENGKYNIPDEYRADVIYGDNIKAITAFLYSEGVVANDRICTFINSLSGDVLSLSTGSIYNFCNNFAEACANHLLFIHDFEVPFSNNMSEKDLRICKNRQKMAGGFRNEKGKQMYCNIMSFVETIKRKKLNIFQNIKSLIQGTPVIQ